MARDVYVALGLQQHDGILRHLNEDEKTKRASTSVGLPKGRDVWVLSESGLYKMITRSDKAEAKPFQEWVTRDVLPLTPSARWSVCGLFTTTPR